MLSLPVTYDPWPHWIRISASAEDPLLQFYIVAFCSSGSFPPALIVKNEHIKLFWATKSLRKPFIINRSREVKFCLMPGETVSIRAWLQGLVLHNLPWSKREVTPLGTWDFTQCLFWQGPLGTDNERHSQWSAFSEHHAPGVVAIALCSLGLLLIAALLSEREVALRPRSG